jgi:hypothetical protein
MSDTNNAILLVPLTARCGDRRVVRAWARVIDDDFGRSLLTRPWSLSECYPASRDEHRNRVRLHQIVYLHYRGTVPERCDIDHADRDKLNNVPGNLRAVERGRNVANTGLRSTNTSGFRGVRWHRAKSKWSAEIGADGRRIYLGYFDDARVAADAVNEAYAKHYPELPPPNPSCGDPRCEIQMQTGLDYIDERG